MLRAVPPASPSTLPLPIGSEAPGERRRRKGGTFRESGGGSRVMGSRETEQSPGSLKGRPGWVQMLGVEQGRQRRDGEMERILETLFPQGSPLWSPRGWKIASEERSDGGEGACLSLCNNHKALTARHFTDVASFNLHSNPRPTVTVEDTEAQLTQLVSGRSGLHQAVWLRSLLQAWVSAPLLLIGWQASREAGLGVATLRFSFHVLLLYSFIHSLIHQTM